MNSDFFIVVPERHFLMHLITKHTAVDACTKEFGVGQNHNAGGWKSGSSSITYEGSRSITYQNFHSDAPQSHYDKHYNATVKFA